MSNREKIMFVVSVLLVVLLGLATAVAAQTTQKTFEPNREITRAEVVTMLWRNAGSPEPSIVAADVFADLDEGAYYVKAVAWAYETGITQGTGDYVPDPLPSRDWSYEVEDAIVKAAEAFGQSPQNLAAIAHCESRGNPSARSSTNDWGLFQHNKSNPGGDAVGRFTRFGFNFYTTWADPYVNAYVAAALADEAGNYQPWYPSRRCHGQYGL